MVEGAHNFLAEAKNMKEGKFVFISSAKAMPAAEENCHDEANTGLTGDAHGFSR